MKKRSITTQCKSSFRQCIFYSVAVHRKRPSLGQRVKCQGPTFCRYIPTRPAALNLTAGPFFKMAPSSKTGEFFGADIGAEVDHHNHFFYKRLWFCNPCARRTSCKAQGQRTSSRGRSLSGMEMSSVNVCIHLRVINDFIKCTSRRILCQRECLAVYANWVRGGATSLLQVLQLASRQRDWRNGRHSESRVASSVFLFGRTHVCLNSYLPFLMRPLSL